VTTSRRRPCAAIATTCFLAWHQSVQDGAFAIEHLAEYELIAYRQTWLPLADAPRPSIAGWVSPDRTIAFQNQTVVYDILFRAASETLRTIAADPEHLGAEIGFLGVLHTWGENLLHHPHIYFLVPGGGIAPDGKGWIACRSGNSGS
jgi:Putative transposase